MLIIGQNKDRE